MSIKVHHISVFISDMDRTIFLFRDILGFTLSWRIPLAKGKTLSSLLGIPDLECELAIMTTRNNDVAIELCRLINPVANHSVSRFGNAGTVGLSLNVRNLDKLHRRLANMGWEPLSPCLKMQSPEGDRIRAFCIQIEGCMMVEFIEQTVIPAEGKTIAQDK